MRRRFTKQIVFIQPTATDGEYRHTPTGARLIRMPEKYVGSVDSAFTSTSDDVYEVLSPPDGVGTSWHAEIDGIRHRIRGYMPMLNLRNIWRVTLEATEPTGTVRE